MKHYLFLFILTIFSSCGIIMINENHYRALNETDKITIHSFDINAAQKTRRDSDEVIIYEINSENIKWHLKQNKYTWIHLWRPFCQSEICQNINMFSQLEMGYKDKGLNLLFVSETYDINAISQITKRTNFNKPIYVLQDSYYGHKTRKNRVSLYNEFNNNKFPSSKYGFDDLLFKDTTLIYACYKLNKNKIDSIMVLKAQ